MELTDRRGLHVTHCNTSLGLLKANAPAVPSVFRSTPPGSPSISVRPGRASNSTRRICRSLSAWPTTSSKAPRTGWSPTWIARGAAIGRGHEGGGQPPGAVHGEGRHSGPRQGDSGHGEGDGHDIGKNLARRSKMSSGQTMLQNSPKRFGPPMNADKASVFIGGPNRFGEF